MSAHRFLILADGQFGPLTSKTANSCVRYFPERIVAVLDRSQAGKTVQEVLGFGGPIPIVGDFAAGLELGATAVLIGIAPAGGQLPAEWRGDAAGSPLTSKTCSMLLAASISQISFSSGDREMPWLGVLSEKPGGMLKPSTGTVYRTWPVLRSLTWKPRKPVAVVKARVCLPLMVKGRTVSISGPTA